MSSEDRAEPLKAFAALIEQVLGFDPALARTQELESALDERLRATHCDRFEQYAALLRIPARAREESMQLAARLAVGETSFFREPGHFEALIEHVIPERLSDDGDRQVRVLSVGCSTGEEPYSLATAAWSAFGLAAKRILIQGVDANPAAIERARRARYSPWALRATPAATREQWFHRNENGYELVERARTSVLFDVKNLFEEDAAFWQPGTADVVFCRNVLIYFSERQIEAAIRRFASVLREGGALFLGHSEMIRDRTGSFETVQSNGVFYHRRIGDSVHARPTYQPADGPRHCRDGDRPRMAATGSGAVAAPEVASPGRTLADATSLFRQEKFAEALSLLDVVRVDADGEAPSLELLRASILANMGSFDAAEAACGRVLELDARCAAAHYLIGLCQEHSGHVEEAALHHRRAIEVDPAFSMSHLRLGVLTRKKGDWQGARRLLEIALLLLPREHLEMLRLLGGGFSADALVSLCRSELRACGAPS